MGYVIAIEMRELLFLCELTVTFIYVYRSIYRFKSSFAKNQYLSIYTLCSLKFMLSKFTVKVNVNYIHGISVKLLLTLCWFTVIFMYVDRFITVSLVFD